MRVYRYTNITLWEVSLPPPLIATYYDPQQQANVIEEIKLLALKGYEVYSSVLEKLCALATEIEGNKSTSSCRSETISHTTWKKKHGYHRNRDRKR